MRSDSVGSRFHARYIHLISCLAALMMASEASAGALFPSPTTYAVGDGPVSVAVADLDGDTIPDLVTANDFSDDVSVLLGNGDGCGFSISVHRGFIELFPSVVRSINGEW